MVQNQRTTEDEYVYVYDEGKQNLRPRRRPRARPRKIIPFITRNLNIELLAAGYWSLAPGFCQQQEARSHKL